MIALQTVAVAFSMFSALPMPQFAWNERNMRYALAAFPFIGAVVGLAFWGWCALCATLGLGAPVQAAGLTVLPIALTGGIHLDGFCDTADALASHGDREKKLAILSDSHIGAFAAIWLGCYLIVWFAFCQSLRCTPAVLWALGLVQVASRAASGFGVAVLPCAKTSGLAHTFATAAARRRVGTVCLCLFVLCGGLLWLAAGAAGAACAGAMAAVFWYYARLSRRQFGGITGDLAGWFLQLAQLAALAVLVGGQALA